MAFFRWLRALGVRVFFSLAMAGNGILANPLRSFLTILGVGIGVASVVSLMGIGEGARQAVVRQFQSLGTNVVIVKALDPAVEFQPELAGELVERVQGLKAATPVVYGEANLRWRRSRGEGQVIGVNEQFPLIRSHPLADGHFFSVLNIEARSPVAVLGFNVASSLMNGRSPVGQTLTINGLTFRIIGVMAAKGAGQGEGIDDKIIMPYSTAMKIAGKTTASEIWGKTETAAEADLAVVQMGRIFRRQLGLDQTAPTVVAGGQGQGEPMPEEAAPVPTAPDGGQSLSGLQQGKDTISITSLNQLVQEADKANRVMTLLLGGIAAVSLLVGGLGIMNIMLVAVSERTGEIGVRRAVGATRGDLMLQFLLEALLLSLVGAVLGVGGGLWGLELFARSGFETAVSLQAIEVASLVAIGSGLLFGVYPALVASSLSPVEALRH